MRRVTKFIGLAGLAGAAVAGVVAGQRRRARAGTSPGGELHAKLHRRPGDVRSNGDQAARTSTSR